MRPFLTLNIITTVMLSHFRGFTHNQLSSFEPTYTPSPYTHTHTHTLRLQWGQLIHSSSSTTLKSQLPNRDSRFLSTFSSCLMSPFLSQGNAISMMRQFLFCLSTNTMSGRLWSSFFSQFK